MSKKCIICGAELEENAIFCDECGEKQGEAEEIKIQSERAKLIEDLEKVSDISIRIGTREMLEHKTIDDLEKLKKNAEGVNDKVVAVMGIIALIGTIACFVKFGFIGGIIGFVICFWVGGIIESGIRKVLNVKNKEAVKAAQKEYLDQKDKLQADIKKYRNEIEELKSDIIYKKYAYLLQEGSVPWQYKIPPTIIEALKDGKANTLDEAIKFSDKR